jgi:citronellyl-CoA synthetase
LGYAHYQFVDRVGDTFRWKSENVSTNEVGELINGYRQVHFSNVYGVEVPNADGRAGMVALNMNEGEENLDIAEFSAFVNDTLPPYARPVFVRVQSNLDVTGTFKMVKGDLKKEGYDLAQVDDPIYVLKPHATAYELLDADFAAAIASGQAGY